MKMLRWIADHSLISFMPILFIVGYVNEKLKSEIDSAYRVLVIVVIILTSFAIYKYIQMKYSSDRDRG